MITAKMLNGNIINFDPISKKLECAGEIPLQELIKKKLATESKDPSQWRLEPPQTTSQRLTNQFIFKVKGLWESPYQHEELCHCRQVPLTHVEELILLGANNQPEISTRSRAGTSCGTCRKDIRDLIEYYSKISEDYK